MSSNAQDAQQQIPPAASAEPQPPPAPVGKKIARFAATDIGDGRAAMLPRNFEEAWRLATLFARAGDFVPGPYQGQPEKCATAILWGMELGLSPLNALASIAPIKGRGALWGDGLKAVAMMHRDYVDCIERELLDDKGEPYGWECTAKRRNRADVVRRFTMADAQRAGLLGKDTPWKTYGANRMCMFRARSWALRDQFPDALRGIYSAEEAIELPATEFADVSPRVEVRMPEATRAIERQENPLNDVAAFSKAFADASPEVPAAADAAPEPIAAPKPLTAGQRAMLTAYRTRAEACDITEQDLIDELGDDVNQGNFERAVNWLTEKITAHAARPL